MTRIPVTRKAAKVEESVAHQPSPSASTLREVHELLNHYASIVNNSDLSQTSKTMYIDFADCFVRWMNSGFQPGMRRPGKKSSNIV
ncbi:MAG TPA: hypothetical protein VFU55_09280 [Terracidiphilus sp.]|nr:hypothetical protein [Terracidiphilus sp.]